MSHKRLKASRPGNAVNAKVLSLVGWVHDGFEIRSIRDLTEGGVDIHLRRGADRRRLRFHHYELPAVLQECASIGVAK